MLDCEGNCNQLFVVHVHIDSNVCCRKETPGERLGDPRQGEGESRRDQTTRPRERQVSEHSHVYTFSEAELLRHGKPVVHVS